MRHFKLVIKTFKETLSEELHKGNVTLSDLLAWECGSSSYQCETHLSYTMKFICYPQFMSGWELTPFNFLTANTKNWNTELLVWD